MYHGALYLPLLLLLALLAWKYSDKLLNHLITRHRSAFSFFILMPASCLSKVFLSVRSKLSVYWNQGEKTHEGNVTRVVTQIRAWNDADRKTRLCTARPGWMAMSFRQGRYKKTMTGITLSHLRNIVRVDPEKKTVLVEPNVSMGELSKALRSMGWTLPVIPELDALTVGGLLCGVGIESSSHRHGLFQHQCVALDLVMPSGEVRHCSASENSDLFKTVPWSWGTMGMLVSAELKIIPYTSHVRLEYHPFDQRAAALAFFQEAASNEQHDFVEGIAFRDDRYVIMVGERTNEVESTRVNRIGRWHKEWFFTYVEKILKKNAIHVEYIPLRDYFHRHTRSLFWEIQDIVPFGNQAWFRYLLGWMMPPEVALLKRTQTEELRQLYEQNHVLQDLLIPISTMDEGLTLLKQHFDLRDPLWLCPMRIFQSDAGQIKPAPTGEEMFVDIGIYGIPLASDFEARQSTRAIEAWVRSVGGYQMLYADTYMTRLEFSQMFDHSLYREVRERHDLTATFPEIYDKVSREARI